MPPNRFESEVESFLEGSHGDRTHIKRADHHTVTPLCGTLLLPACNGGGFALHEAVAQRVASVSDPHVVQFPPLLSAACGFVCAPGFPRVLMGAHTFSLRSRNVTVSQVCSRHIQCRLCHRIRAGTPAQSASITSTTTRP